MAKSKTPVTTPQAAQAVAILEKLSDTRKELRSLALNFLKPNLGFRPEPINHKILGQRESSRYIQYLSRKFHCQ